MTAPASPRTPSPRHKAVARHALDVFGGRPSVRAYHHDHIENLSIDLLEVADRPEAGLASFSTIGLFGTQLLHTDGSPLRTRVELCAEMPTGLGDWATVLATAAFSIMQDGHAVMPGHVLADCVAQHYDDTTVPHLYLCVPFSWRGGDFPRFEQDALLVNWLQAVPVSETERRFIEREGHEAFEDALLEQDPDIHDLKRPSCL